MLDLLIHNATLPDGRTNMSVAVQNGRIVEVTAGLVAPAHETLDAQGQLLSPPFIDAHFHMDATLSYGLPRVNASGTLPPFLQTKYFCATMIKYFSAGTKNESLG
jgi:cytosine deaminase